MLIDAHCHIHEPDYPLDPEVVIEEAHKAGVMQMICAGTSVENSRLAIEFANNHEGVFATVGIHPHYASLGLGDLESLLDLNNKKIVAIGEIGLDYHYDHSSREDQKKLLRAQIQLALDRDMPIVFHVRESFDDFWPIFDSYKGIKGELHGYSDNSENMEKAVQRGLYIGVTGISTFTKDEAQKQTYSSIPLNKIILETDAPYLTPVPFRGMMNQPAYVRDIAIFSGKNRQISENEIAAKTTANAQALFRL